MVDSLVPFRIVSASEQVAGALRTSILSGELKAGDVINLNETAEKLGVSNTPVREALQVLQQEDWVRLRRNRGAEVIGLTPKRIRDYYQVRALLEGEAARMAATAEDVSVVVNTFQKIEQKLHTGGIASYNTFNKEFHMAIWSLCDNEKMFSMMSKLWNSSSRAVHSAEREYVELAMEEHRRINDAIAAHDSERACWEMKHHLERSMKDVLTHFVEDGIT